ncbi:MAG: cytochrome c oxidase subunit [Pseudomonadota bacterium]|jgi:cytochrome c oxidase subunit 2
MMRRIERLILSFVIALAPLPALAQGDAPAAAPVPAVTTADVPTATPQYVPTTPGVGVPDIDGIRLQAPVTEIGREAHALVDGVVNPVMFGVSIFVLLLLAWTVIRFRARANPVASKTSHNTTIEVIWTAVPVLILVWIAVPSFRLLANQYTPPKADITIKATGHQWYWEYSYPDQGDFSFDSVMLTEDEAAKRGSPNLLDVDNRIVLPVGTTVRVLTTAADVIHAFAIPSFWVQMDAVPGRINETWFKVEKPGVYYGQCFQLCGTKHGFMPIAIEVVSKERFAAWVAAKQKENGIAPPAAAAPAAAAPAAAPAAVPVADAAPATAKIAA